MESFWILQTESSTDSSERSEASTEDQRERKEVATPQEGSREAQNKQRKRRLLRRMTREAPQSQREKAKEGTFFESIYLSTLFRCWLSSCFALVALGCFWRFQFTTKCPTETLIRSTSLLVCDSFLTASTETLMLLKKKRVTSLTPTCPSLTWNTTSLDTISTISSRWSSWQQTPTSNVFCACREQTLKPSGELKQTQQTNR